MIDGYTHVNMSAPHPLEDLRMQMEFAGVTGAFVVETWNGENYGCIQQLIERPSAQFRGAFCFRSDRQRTLFEELKNPSIAGLRVRTVDLARLGSLAESLEESGKWLVAHAESGIGRLRDGLLRFFEQHPTLRIYVPHLGWPCQERQNDRDWNAAMRDLSSLPNCIVGISAIEAFSNEPYPHRDIHECAVRLHELFGAQRTMIGSDYPLCQKDMYSEYMTLARQWSQSPSGQAPAVAGPEVELFQNQEDTYRHL